MRCTTRVLIVHDVDELAARIDEERTPGNRAVYPGEQRAEPVAYLALGILGEKYRTRPCFAKNSPNAVVPVATEIATSTAAHVFFASFGGRR
jgi:hypothetical protein